MSEPFNPMSPANPYTGPQPVPAPLGAPAATPQPEPIDVGEVIADLEKFRSQALEGLGATSAFVFQPGGPRTEVFRVRHPLLLSDEQNNQLAKPMSFVEIAKLLLDTADDPEVYNRFKAAGGQAGDIMIAWRSLSAGLDVPK